MGFSCWTFLWWLYATAVDNCSIAKLFNYDEYQVVDKDWVLNRTHGEMLKDVHTCQDGL